MSSLRSTIELSRSTQAARSPLLPALHPESDEGMALSLPQPEEARPNGEPLPLGSAPPVHDAGARAPRVHALCRSLASEVSNMAAAFAGADRARGRASRLEVVSSQLETAYESGAQCADIEKLTWKVIKVAYGIGKASDEAGRLKYFRMCADLHERAADHGAMVDESGRQRHVGAVPRSALMAKITDWLSHHYLYQATGVRISVHDMSRSRWDDSDEMNPIRLNSAAFFKAIKYYAQWCRFRGESGERASWMVHLSSYFLKMGVRSGEDWEHFERPFNRMLEENPLRFSDFTEIDLRNYAKGRSALGFYEDCAISNFDLHVHEVIRNGLNVAKVFDQSMAPLSKNYKGMADRKNLISGITDFLV